MNIMDHKDINIGILGLFMFGGDTKSNSKLCVKVQGSNKFALGVNEINIPFSIVESNLDAFEKASVPMEPIVHLQRSTTKSSLISVNKAPFINTTSMEQFGSSKHKANITFNVSKGIFGPVKGDCNLAQEIFNNKLVDNLSITSVWEGTRNLLETHEGSEGR
jgi:hypothetical protein